jgi:hypothetical protein
VETSTTFDRAMALRRQGKLGEALPLFLAAIREDPLNPEVWYRAARTALKLNRYGQSAQLFESCLRFAPNHLGAANGLWYARLCVGDFEGSLAACRRALELDPGNIEALNMVGNLSYLFGRPEEGRDAHMRALALEEQAPTRNWTCATVRLVQGDYERGWQYFEPGAAGAQPGRQVWAPPKDRVWRGEVARGRTVCIYKNGGNGDVFLFARYVPLVASRVGRVVMTAPETHDRLLASLPGLSGVHRHPTEAGDDALFTHLWALPGIFGTMPDTVPDTVPYLQPPASGPVLPPAAGLRVGLAWAGHPNTPINFDRSIPSAELLQRLVGIPGIDWVALQVGYRAEYADGLPFAARPVLTDFGDTAFVLRQLDLLVTVDTAIANLAGALGVPAWVMVPTYPEFRWGTEGEVTPWYPGLRLFRRANSGDWDGVIARVAAALAERRAGAGRAV